MSEYDTTTKAEAATLIVQGFRRAARADDTLALNRNLLLDEVREIERSVTHFDLDAALDELRHRGAVISHTDDRDGWTTYALNPFEDVDTIVEHIRAKVGLGPLRRGGSKRSQL